MCGRYYLDLDILLTENFDSNNRISYETNFNITPQSKVPVLVENKLTMATWGFFPDWTKSQKNSKPLFNTRWETIQEKRTFQTALHIIVTVWAAQHMPLLSPCPPILVWMFLAKLKY